MNCRTCRLLTARGSSGICRRSRAFSASRTVRRISTCSTGGVGSPLASRCSTIRLARRSIRSFGEGDVPAEAVARSRYGLPSSTAPPRDWRAMTTEEFLLALGVGSALIAFWLAIRFPDRAPADFPRAMLHVGAAFAVVLLE